MIFYKKIATFLFLGLGINSGSGQQYLEIPFALQLSETEKYIANRYVREEIPPLDVKSKVKFLLYTREGDDGEVIEPGDLYSLSVSHFSFQKPTKILIHGFFDSRKGEMIKSIRKNYLLVGGVNVVVVDWSEISITLNYITAAIRTKDVGVLVSEMIEFLVQQGAKHSSFHLIGHSLGSHVAGSAGNSMKSGKIARITGLDPAYPGFFAVDLAHRLQETDADFVDVIHTCGGILGFFDPLGHVDFYTNGGLNPQPGCPSIDLGICSHFRAFKFYAESILHDHKFPGFPCISITPNSRNCQQSSRYDDVLMGHPTNNSIRGLYYVYTNSNPPFAPVVGK